MENYHDSYHKQEQQTLSLNPFISAWLHPKQTARYMMNVKSTGFAILVMSIGYIGTLLSGVMDVGISVWGMILLCVILAPISGVIGTALSALVAWLFGKLFKGTATFSELFKVMSLATIPFITLIPFYLIWLFTSPDSLLIWDYTGPTPWIYWPATLASIVSSIWSFVIAVGAVAEAHQFSNWRAFFTLLIPGLIFGVIAFVLIFIVIIGMVGISMM